MPTDVKASRRKIIWFAAAALGAAAVLLLNLPAGRTTRLTAVERHVRHHDSKTEDAPSPAAARTRRGSPPERIRPVHSNPAENGQADWQKVFARKSQMPFVSTNRAEHAVELPPERQRLLDDIEAAYEAEDLQATLSFFEKARNAPEKEIRSSMIWSLGWFGKATIAQLTEFLSDEDAEISNEALGQWNSAIQEVSEETEKVKWIETAMERVNDPDTLEDLALEYAGIDEKTAVESLLRVLSRNNAAASAQARETYETLTGTPFTTTDAAYRWLREQE